MKIWLKEQEDKQNKLFNNLLEITQYTIKNINPDDNIAFRIIFEKDEWKSGRVLVDVLEKNIDNKQNEQEIFYKKRQTYTHFITNIQESIDENSILAKLMKEGIFTNSWFSVLDASRKCDTTILFKNNGYTLEHEFYEYLEDRMKSTHSGFNGFYIENKKEKLNKP